MEPHSAVAQIEGGKATVHGAQITREEITGRPASEPLH